MNFGDGLAFSLAQACTDLVCQPTGFLRFSETRELARIIQLQPPTKDLVTTAGGAVFFHMHRDALRLKGKSCL